MPSFGFQNSNGTFFLTFKSLHCFFVCFFFASKYIVFTVFCSSTCNCMSWTHQVSIQPREISFFVYFQLSDHCWPISLLTSRFLNAKYACLFVDIYQQCNCYLSVNTLTSENMSGTSPVVSFSLNTFLSAVSTWKCISHTILLRFIL